MVHSLWSDTGNAPKVAIMFCTGPLVLPWFPSDHNGGHACSVTIPIGYLKRTLDQKDTHLKALTIFQYGLRLTVQWQALVLHCVVPMQLAVGHHCCQLVAIQSQWPEQVQLQNQRLIHHPIQISEPKEQVCSSKKCHVDQFEEIPKFHKQGNLLASLLKKQKNVNLTPFTKCQKRLEQNKN